MGQTTAVREGMKAHRRGGGPVEGDSCRLAESSTDASSVSSPFAVRDGMWERRKSAKGDALLPSRPPKPEGEKEADGSPGIALLQYYIILRESSRPSSAEHLLC